MKRESLAQRIDGLADRAAELVELADELDGILERNEEREDYAGLHAELETFNNRFREAIGD